MTPKKLDSSLDSFLRRQLQRVEEGLLHFGMAAQRRGPNREIPRPGDGGHRAVVWPIPPAKQDQ